MKMLTNHWQHLLAALYVWLVSTYFGAILLDIVYANTILKALKPAETAPLFSQAADFLLLISTLTILVALGAIGSSWRSRSARNLFIASALFVLAELLIPMLFFSLFRQMQVSLGFNVGLWVRLSGSALSSMLALVGLWKLHSAA